jgi:hypothetical protein
MTEIELKVPSIGNTRGKAIGIGIAIVVIGLLLVDFVVLRGEQVDYDSASLRGGEPMVLSISRVGEEHLVEIDTHRRMNGENKGQTVKIRFEDPDGKLVYEKSELTAHKDRYFRFTPEVAGEYRLYVEPKGNLFGPGSGRARAAVFVNDRRIVARLLAFMPV